MSRVFIARLLSESLTLTFRTSYFNTLYLLETSTHFLPVQHSQ
jgi:hypothetical protein